jgi:gamma-glutamylcyclotransferase (GGCT)/AIG2-like uncharacterized protein YtfP
MQGVETHPPMMPEALQRHVFVYGTLRRGGRNDINRLEPAPRYVGMGEVHGVLYHMGWYPGLALGGAEAVTVVGEVYAITPQLEAVLDRIERIEPGVEGEYAKRELEVEIEGRPLVCLLYELNPAHAAGRERIAHGDWIAFHDAQT